MARQLAVGDDLAAHRVDAEERPAAGRARLQRHQHAPFGGKAGAGHGLLLPIRRTPSACRSRRKAAREATAG